MFHKIKFKVKETKYQRFADHFYTTNVVFFSRFNNFKFYFMKHDIPKLEKKLRTLSSSWKELNDDTEYSELFKNYSLPRLYNSR